MKSEYKKVNLQCDALSHFLEGYASKSFLILPLFPYHCNNLHFMAKDNIIKRARRVAYQYKLCPCLEVCPWRFSLNTCLSSSQHLIMFSTWTQSPVSKGSELHSPSWHPSIPRCPVLIHQYQNVTKGKRIAKYSGSKEPAGYHLLTV